ncbi:hypothetical protein TTHERM_00460570 (macronuclear) [Tetrahymena thermophila SB210]|uniref:Uncharacterized protein n=1 Tax=Tetrahymena thermophila (strain SB210) TaxID=312017 RepID=Q23Q27_TETTS|nr:hypothetical protein TTHERM_00460570 [Tetrahymena thermophila SB210]EAR98508.1 hypothetical protein TTHERM_00460570 [Tetrahymena thermophila SB210]|eukprot:XP_001018753.1 hypothetical protein TTHERM_00460570 [Tetrahymena thermophila SB210]
MQFNYTHQQLQYASPFSLQVPILNMLQTQQNQYFSIPAQCNYRTPLNPFTYEQLNLFNNQQQLQMNVQTDLLGISQISNAQQQFNSQQLYQNNLFGFQNQYDYKPIVDNQQQLLQISNDFQPIQYINTSNNLMDQNLLRDNALVQTSTSFSQPEVIDNITHNIQLNDYQEQANIFSKQIQTIFQEDLIPQQLLVSQKQKNIKKQVVRKNQKQRNSSKSVINNNITSLQNQNNIIEQTAQLNQDDLIKNHTQTLLKIEQNEQQLKTEFESTLFKQSEPLIKFENLDENMNESKSFSTSNNLDTKQNSQNSIIKSQDQKLINQKLAVEKARQQEEQIKLQLIEDLDPSKREILRLAIQTNRQNINRNFIKQYKLYVNSQVKYVLNYEKSDQQKYQFRSCKNQPVKLITDPTPQEKTSFQKKFNKFIASKIYSNNDIKQIIENKIYGFLFQEFLNNEIADWIEQNISDRKSDYLCIVKFYLLCCQQNQYLCFMNDNYSLNRKNIQYFTNF